MAAEAADVLIIGAGAAGAVAALRLAEEGLDVVCLEQGQWPDRASFLAGRPEGDLVARRQWSPSPTVRVRPADYPIDHSMSEMAPLNFNGVGGGTVLYNAQWPRLLPTDFEVRSRDGVADDWPLSYDELLPLYEATDRQFAVSGLGGNPAYPPGVDPPLPPLPIGEAGLRVARAHGRLGWHWWPETNAIASVDLDERRHRCVQRGTCIQGCGEGAKASTDLTHWPAAVAAGVELITGARVREITIDRSGRATGAAWIDRDGRDRWQAADTVLLAANGIGTARLLLLSTSQLFPDGLANSSGLVGRRLMLHPLASVTGIFDEQLHTWRGHAGALVHSLHFYRTDERRGFVRGARWSLGPGGGALRIALAGSAWGPDHHRHLAERLGRSVHWTILGEDLPDPDNHVALSPHLTDDDGVPAPQLHYRVGANSRALLDWHVTRAGESLVEAGAVKVEATSGPANGHFLGTARMGDDPASSVVDRWGMAHDVPNLGIIDGSTFVTAGGVNPTSTICALALRTAEHLLRHRGRPPSRRSTARPRGGTVTHVEVGPGGSDAAAVRSPTTGLSGEERAAFAVLADQLIPAADGMPSYGELDGDSRLLDRVLGVRPDLLDAVRRAAGRAEDHRRAGRDPADLLPVLAEADRPALEAAKLAAAGAYYMSEAVMRLHAYPEDPALPVPAPGFPDYAAEGLLDDVPAGAVPGP